MKGEMVLVSACLLGICCRYDGRAMEHQAAMELLASRRALPFCPEQAGGLTTPRAPSEIQGDRVFSCRGDDVTAFFVRGAYETLKLCRRASVSLALLRERSPSCGSRWVCDGTFSGRLVAGSGMTARLLAAHGIEILSDQEDLWERLPKRWRKV